MALTVKVTEAVYEGETSITHTTIHTVQTVLKMEESVADAVTDQEHLVSIDISQLKAFYMVSDQALTVETNSGGTPVDSFTLTANRPVVWQTGDTAIFTADVTALYLSNSSGSTATFKLIAGTDV